MERVILAFGIHNHQPVGNFESVFRKGADECYLPFLEMAAKRPSFRFSVHTSGPLLEWFDKCEPRYRELIQSMVASKQIELVGGGFYEPILPVWPREHSIAQIKLMRSELKKRYDCDPGGIWLAERVWDPALPETLADAGVEYTVLDDTHFKYAGLSEDEIVGHFVTERAGKKVFVIPISKQLRYMIPFKEPNEILGYLQSIAQRHPGTVVTYADDGEKFGMWPGTKDWVYSRGWLSRFFDALESARDWLTVVPLREALERPCGGRIYLPCASYEEMMEWAQPAKTIVNYKRAIASIDKAGISNEVGIFVRGGFWDNFFAKYPESNLLHKRILHLAEKIEKAVGPPDAADDLHPAWRHLFRAQCNCAYWHGLFGGVYLSYLRHALWENLLEAEALVNENSSVAIDVVDKDIDIDGANEIMLSNGKVRWGFTQKGGACMIAESVEKQFAYHNVMTRRFEAYHASAVKRPGTQGNGSGAAPATIHDIKATLDEAPKYDRFPRHSFMDHFFPHETTIKNFIDGDWNELGGFMGMKWNSELRNENSHAEAIYRAESTIGGVKVAAKKKFIFNKRGEIEARIEFQPQSNWPRAMYGIAFNFTLLAPDAPDRYYLFDGVRPTNAAMNSESTVAGVRRIEAVDEWKKLALVWETDRPVEIWRAPITTVSHTEEGFEKAFQGSWILIKYPLPESNRTMEINISIKIEPKG